MKVNYYFLLESNKIFILDFLIKNLGPIESMIEEFDQQMMV